MGGSWATLTVGDCSWKRNRRTNELTVGARGGETGPKGGFTFIGSLLSVNFEKMRSIGPLVRNQAGFRVGSALTCLGSAKVIQFRHSISSLSPILRGWSASLGAVLVHLVSLLPFLCSKVNRAPPKIIGSLKSINSEKICSVEPPLVRIHADFERWAVLLRSFPAFSG